MDYCKKDEEAFVIYKLGNKEERFKSYKTPIKINTYEKHLESTKNFNRNGYGLTFYSTNNRAWFYDLIVVDYIIIDYGEGESKEFRYALYWTECQDVANNYINKRSLNFDPATFSINQSKKCFQPVEGGRCYIEVLHQDSIVFTDQGDCPCTFTVQCGDCPEGTIRCDSSGYPGYCCIPCAELAQRVNAMTRRL